mmetsp:Transcript_58233/g.96457  ORF Transcript_58233/g.96457 Transcript_58233/m.96457 type:complete len:325 (+) Transcript_58233:609-1583(+)
MLLVPHAQEVPDFVPHLAAARFGEDQGGGDQGGEPLPLCCLRLQSAGLPDDVAAEHPRGAGASIAVPQRLNGVHKRGVGLGQVPDVGEQVEHVGAEVAVFGSENLFLLMEDSEGLDGGGAAIIKPRVGGCLTKRLDLLRERKHPRSPERPQQIVQHNPEGALVLVMHDHQDDRPPHALGDVLGPLGDTHDHCPRSDVLYVDRTRPAPGRVRRQLVPEHGRPVELLCVQRLLELRGQVLPVLRSAEVTHDVAQPRGFHVILGSHRVVHATLQLLQLLFPAEVGNPTRLRPAAAPWLRGELRSQVEHVRGHGLRLWGLGGPLVGGG